jgi:hypothetical protein
MKYRIAYQYPGKPVGYFRKTYTDLISAESAADDYNVGEPFACHWVEPIGEPVEVSLNCPHHSLTISSPSLSNHS